MNDLDVFPLHGHETLRQVAMTIAERFVDKGLERSLFDVGMADKETGRWVRVRFTAEVSYIDGPADLLDGGRIAQH